MSARKKDDDRQTLSNSADSEPALSVVFLQVLHDDDCPGANGDPENCVCQPAVHAHRDAARFASTYVRSREQRRQAERATAKALRRAAGKR